MNQTMLARCSYGPYARSMIRICMEENFHKKQGQEMVILLSQGSEEQQAMVQDSINRFWWPSLMMFGPHDKNSPNTPTLVKWGIKTRLNDELRQDFINQMVPDLQALGLRIPDPDLKFNSETGDWEIGEIDWEEFWRVVKGDGPMNKERIAAKQKAHDDGAWVRDAMVAYAEKQSVGVV